ncbi:hypothetical protein CKO44_16025 [Rubrivivax gelatinosus]|uniref:hypothetical protein n=1 Tax=Rubrivivax gelatinosus TaxID=28068 RepID=UPI0019084D9F|nr:hypothetical protein [Rubrivivax gelatinosus]MBK1614977.1 hypothetical protein [Rubrivivax gelatinosus]MBZ8142969.1 hypothetical protein [Rubrivivax gelatinosus]
MSLNPCSEGMLKAFRLVRDAGGWWTAAEVGKQLLRDMDAARAAQTAGRWLGALARHGYVARRPGAPTCTYGVTSACLPPDGESLVPSTRPPVLVEADEALA